MYTNRGFLKRDLHFNSAHSSSPSPPKHNRSVNNSPTKFTLPPKSITPTLPSKNKLKSNNLNFRTFDDRNSSRHVTEPFRHLSPENYSYKDINRPKINPSFDMSDELNPFGTHNFSPEPFNNKPLPINPPKSFTIDSLFEIYQDEDPINNTASSIGAGFLITSNLAITLNSVIPTERISRICTARFLDVEYLLHNFDADSCFLTNRSCNFTIIGFKYNPKTSKSRVPIEIREDFKLKTGNTILYYEAIIPKVVTSIEHQSFCYSAHKYILPGSPIFDRYWKLQGLHISTSKSFKHNTATRIDLILHTIHKYLSHSTHRDLDLLFSNSSDPPILQPSHHFELDLRYMYWIKGLSRYMYRYDIELNRWNTANIENMMSFLSGETNEWCFPMNYRIVYSVSSVYIIGGKSTDLTSISSDVYEYEPVSRCLYRRASMIEKRESCCAVYLSGCIYVMGGKYAYNSCEKYIIAQDIWTKFPNLNYGRYEATATVMNFSQDIYIIGGLPLEDSATKIEKFSFERFKWEVLNIKLPEPIYKPAVYAVSSNKLAIIGGHLARSVSILKLNTGGQAPILIPIEQLTESIETDFPVIFHRMKDCCYILKETHKKHPQVLYYPLVKLQRVPLDYYIDTRDTPGLPNIHKVSKLTSKYEDSY